MKEVLEECQKVDIFVNNLTEMKKYPEIDKSKIGVNPFTESLIIQASLRMDSEAKVKDSNTGISIPATQLVEKDKSTKIYVSAALRNKIIGMSTGAQTMLWYVVCTIEPGDEWIRMYPDIYADKTGSKSINTYKKAVKELIIEGFLTESVVKYVYWINPSKFFNGNRLEKYVDNVLITNHYTGKNKGTTKPVGIYMEKQVNKNENKA